MTHSSNRQGPHRSTFLTSLMALLLATLLTGCEWELFDKNADEDDDNEEEMEPIDSASQVTGLEIGVSDLAMSLPVYRDGLDMRIVDDETTDNSRRITLESPGSPLEATLTLIEFTDGVGRNLQDNPGKIVFYTPDAEALANQFATAGGRVTLPPTEQPGFGAVSYTHLTLPTNREV